MIQRGFTLVELLVVIAIIGVLVGLLLPAVQAAREAARRMSCGNNIRQVSLGVTNFDSAFKHFPENFGTAFSSAQGIYTDPAPLTETQKSWMTAIFPYIEMTSMYEQINANFDVTNDPRPFVPQGIGTNGQVAEQLVKLYRCPSDTTPTTLGNRGGRAGAYAVTSYKGVSGSNWVWGDADRQSLATLPSGAVNPFRRDPFLTGVGGAGNGNAYGNGNGIFYPGFLGMGGYYGGSVTPDVRGQKCITLTAAIKDGMSNTFMIGESVGTFNTKNWWFWFDGSTATCSIPLNANASASCTTLTGNRRVDLTTCAANWENNNGFMSEHSGGGQFAMADGSVKFIANTVDIFTYRAMGSMQDGQTVRFQTDVESPTLISVNHLNPVPLERGFFVESGS